MWQSMWVPTTTARPTYAPPGLLVPVLVMSDTNFDSSRPMAFAPGMTSKTHPHFAVENFRKNLVKNILMVTKRSRLLTSRREMLTI